MYATARRLFSAGPVTLGTTAATALHPLVIYFSAHINNEILAAVWVALAFYCLARGSRAILAGVHGWASVWRWRWVC